MSSDKYGALGPWGDGDLMAMAAVRYSLGRRTYVPGECVRWLIRQWPNFSDACKRVIQRDIEEAFASDDKVRTCGGAYQAFKPLGDDCDRAEWEKTRSLWT